MFGKGSEKINPAAVQKLAQTGEVQQLMELLQKNGSVQDAAKKASGGDTSALLGMVQQLMSTEEGADLIQNIQKKAKDAGIE